MTTHLLPCATHLLPFTTIYYLTYLQPTIVRASDRAAEEGVCGVGERVVVAEREQEVARRAHGPQRTPFHASSFRNCDEEAGERDRDARAPS